MNVRYVHVACHYIQIFPWKRPFKKLFFSTPWFFGKILLQVFVLSQDISWVSVLMTLHAHYAWNINSKRT